MMFAKHDRKNTPLKIDTVLNMHLSYRTECNWKKSDLNLWMRLKPKNPKAIQIRKRKLERASSALHNLTITGGYRLPLRTVVITVTSSTWHPKTLRPKIDKRHNKAHSHVAYQGEGKGKGNGEKGPIVLTSAQNPSLWLGVSM